MVLAAVVHPLLFTAFCFPVELSVRNLLLLVIFQNCLTVENSASSEGIATEVFTVIASPKRSASFWILME